MVAVPQKTARLVAGLREPSQTLSLSLKGSEMTTADQGLCLDRGPPHPSSLNMLSPTQALLIFSMTSVGILSWGPNPQRPTDPGNI